MLAALLLMASCVPDALYSPTPVLAHDQVLDADLAGYALYYRVPGGVFQKLVDWPCVWWDSDDDGTDDVRSCRAADQGAPLQRYCPSCEQMNEYEFALKAFDDSGNYSSEFSNAVSVCMPPCVEF